MKKHLITTALTCGVMLLSSVSLANAAETTSKSVRIAQERLTSLGYYVGGEDGKLGEVTRDALRDFQAHNGLAVTGALTGETYSLLKVQDMAGVRDYYAPQRYGYNGYYTNPYAANGYYNNVAYAPAAYTGYNAVAPAPVASGYWNRVQAQSVPIRFGQLAINDDTRSGTHNVSVTLNGQPVLVANNQPQALRVSHTYRMSGEDAVIFTAYDGADACSYKSYLLTVRANGTYVAPQQVGNCSGSYQARVENDMLYISFANPYTANGYASLDAWRYAGGALMRI